MAQILNCIDHVGKDENVRSSFGHQILVTIIFNELGVLQLNMIQKERSECIHQFQRTLRQHRDLAKLKVIKSYVR